MSNFGTFICASGDTKTEIMKFEAGIQNTARVQNCPDITSLVSNGASHRVGHEDGHGSVMGSGGRLSWLGHEVGSIVKNHFERRKKVPEPFVQLLLIMTCFFFLTFSFILPWQIDILRSSIICLLRPFSIKILARGMYLILSISWVQWTRYVRLLVWYISFVASFILTFSFIL